MIFKRLLIFLAAASIANAAITERYVNSAGSGAADGTSEANAMAYATFIDYMITGGSFTAAAGDRFNLIDATYARTTTTDSWVNGGSATSPVVVRGYNTTVTDGYQGRTNDNGAIVTTNMPTISYTTGAMIVSGSFILIQSLQITSTRNGAAITSSGADTVFYACAISNATTGASGNGLSMTGRGSAINCDITLSNGGNAGANATFIQVAGTKWLYNRITSTAVGMESQSAGLVLVGNTFFGSTGNQLSITGTGGYSTILNNTFVGGGADAINIVTGSTIQHVIVGNMITDQTGDGIDMVSTANSAFIAYNRLRDNANSFANGGDWVTATSFGQSATDTGTTGTTATDYVNYAGGDYNLVSGSPATSAAIPLNASIGALQRDQASVGGGQTSNAFAK
jgi:hypothetical protein